MKEIEEMAKDLHEELETENIPYHECDFMAQRLIKKGWVKPNEHSVILSGKQCVEIIQDNYNIGYERGSKETAEEILNTEFFIFETENRSEEYQKGYMQAVRECRSRRDELSEQFCVEIKE